MRLTLSWPPTALWPNRKSSWRFKSAYSRAARDEAYVRTLEALAGQTWAGPDGAIMLTVTGHKPAERGQDIDGFTAALKPSFDGIASALKVNDIRFRPVVDWGADDPPRGSVTVDIR